eukprot:scaffold4705_cov193-Alexandrium_tamarense.AAC.3
MTEENRGGGFVCCDFALRSLLAVGGRMDGWMVVEISLSPFIEKDNKYREIVKWSNYRHLETENTYITPSTPALPSSARCCLQWQLQEELNNGQLKLIHRPKAMDCLFSVVRGKKLQEIDTLRDDITSSASTATEAKTKIRLAYVEREGWKDCVAPCKYAHG